ncbi:proton-conducting transporter membrane subunit [Devosia oryzisoli]|uniref:proton-conducting transporter transmembrane domain-containing protein n=1 Tax=Devosia oryzisoli TaxID=2774138 RepID=UPI0031F49A9A
MTSLPLTAFAPAVLLLAAFFFLLRQGPRPGRLLLLANMAAAAGLALGLAGVVQLLLAGQQVLSLGGVAILRLNPVSATMILLVSFVGWVVVRYSSRYLDGEQREGRFHGLILAAVASVLVTVQAANLPVLILGFVMIGLLLRQLLLFYPERAEARRAATKFTGVWAAGDVSLVLASAILWITQGTLNFVALGATSELTPVAQLGIGLLVLASVLKTAALPTHGWVTEVMEAPTPVSALLHAGIINSGGVMLIMLAGLVQQSPGAMGVLVAIGGLTALFGALVMLTQSAVKTALAWSTIAQMGFMLLQCGLGLWPLALLHIVAHSLYKAHAFLSSGKAVREVNAIRKPGPVAVPSIAAVTRSFVLGLVLFAGVAAIFSVLGGHKSPQALALGTILVFGVSYLIAQGLADAAPAALTRRTVGASLATTIAYFAFQWVAQALWGSSLPAVPTAGPLEWALIVLAVSSFGLVAFAQALFPLWAHHPTTAGLRVHVANGFYLNALLDRFLGGFQLAHKQ